MEEARHILDSTFEFYVNSDVAFDEKFWSMKPLSTELIRSLPEEEQQAISKEIACMGHRIIIARVRRLHPDWTEGQIRAETFRQTYPKDFPPEKLEEIAETLRRFHDGPS